MMTPLSMLKTIFTFYQDIIDTGRTMKKMLEILAKYKPAKVRVAR